MSDFFEAKAITMTFGGLTAVNKVDLSIEKGMIASLIGPNGAGKTTFFNTITRVYNPTSGEMTFEGKSFAGLKPFNITALGIARTFQNIRLFPGMTALENLMVAQHNALMRASGLTFLGLQAMIDPPRPEAAASIIACRRFSIASSRPGGVSAAFASIGRHQEIVTATYPRRRGILKDRKGPGLVTPPQTEMGCQAAGQT